MVELIIYLVILLVIGIMLCINGKELYIPTLMISVFYSCFILFTRKFGFELEGILLGSIIGGVLALLVKFIYKSGLFITGFVIGFILTILLINLLPWEIGMYKWIIAIVLAIVTGTCAIKWSGIIIMMATSFQGAFMIISSLGFAILNWNKLSQFVYSDGTFSTISNLNQYLENDFLNENSILLFVGLIGISLVSFIYQFSKNKATTTNIYK